MTPLHLIREIPRKLLACATASMLIAGIVLAWHATHHRSTPPVATQAYDHACPRTLAQFAPYAPDDPRNKLFHFMCGRDPLVRH